MTSNENMLALRLVGESFGALAAQVAALLLKKSACPLMLIAQDLALDKKKVAEVLTILTAHGLVEYRLNARQMVEYSFRTDRALSRLKIAR
jgi:transcription initiation factor IIE alpha subunit